MALVNEIRIKRTTTANAPLSLTFGELAFADGANKLFIGKNDGSVLEISSAQILSDITFTAPSEVFTATNTEGALDLSFKSQTANQILASPDGANGTPSFRELVASDIQFSFTDIWGGEAESDIIMQTHRIRSLADPLNYDDAATKSYVDSLVQGLSPKESVKVATVENITLSGSQVIDGVSLNIDDRVLVKNQTNSFENGIYKVVTGGPWVRVTDADSWEELLNSFVYVDEGTTNFNNSYVCTTTADGTLDTDPITFIKFSNLGTYEAGNGLTRSGRIYNVVGTTDRIISNNDSIDIASTYAGQSSISTLGTITTGTWNGSIIDIAYGGTGASTAADARTNLGLSLGSDVQAFNSKLEDLSTYAFQANQVVYYDGSNMVGTNSIDGGTY